MRSLLYYDTEIEYQLEINRLDEENEELRRKVVRLENHLIGAERRLAQLEAEARARAESGVSRG